MHIAGSFDLKFWLGFLFIVLSFGEQDPRRGGGGVVLDGIVGQTNFVKMIPLARLKSALTWRFLDKLAKLSYSLEQNFKKLELFT